MLFNAPVSWELVITSQVEENRITKVVTSPLLPLVAITNIIWLSTGITLHVLDRFCSLKSDFKIELIQVIKTLKMNWDRGVQEYRK